VLRTLVDGQLAQMSETTEYRKVTRKPATFIFRLTAQRARLALPNGVVWLPTTVNPPELNVGEDPAEAVFTVTLPLMSRSYSARIPVDLDRFANRRTITETHSSEWFGGQSAEFSYTMTMVYPPEQ
jgi:hypothetical protein